MFDVNALAPMVGCAEEVETFQHGCADNATLEGELLSPLPPGKRQLCDKVIGEDAINKLQRAAAGLKATGQPFFLATGFRKPHTPWRFPAAYLQYYNKDQTVDVRCLFDTAPIVRPIAPWNSQIAANAVSGGSTRRVRPFGTVQHCDIVLRFPRPVYAHE
jgi:hypothetical protein